MKTWSDRAHLAFDITALVLLLAILTTSSAEQVPTTVRIAVTIAGGILAIIAATLSVRQHIAKSRQKND